MDLIGQGDGTGLHRYCEQQLKRIASLEKENNELKHQARNNIGNPFKDLNS
jgi:hypothetical protein